MDDPNTRDHTQGDEGEGTREHGRSNGEYDIAPRLDWTRGFGHGKDAESYRGLFVCLFGDIFNIAA